MHARLFSYFSLLCAMITHHKAPYCTKDTYTYTVYILPDILLVYERRILRNTFRPIQSKNGWRIRNNNKLQKLIKREHIVKYIKAQRIKLLGYLSGMKDIKLVKKITDWNRTGVRTKGRAKNN